MPILPTGTVTFLYTDVEGSTTRWEHHPQQMRAAMERHDAILQRTIAESGGVVFRTEGDAFRAVFPTAPEALSAVLAAQRALCAEEWPAEVSPFRVRMALHTGIGEVGGGDYVGPPLNRVARLLSAGYGGQTLVSSPTADLISDSLPPGVSLRDLGEHRLKDLQRPEHIYQLVAPDLPADFPPIKTLDNRPNNLPVQRSPIVGREKEIAAIQQLLLREDTGLITLTGPGGIGKTRLSVQVAAELADRFPDGVYFVSLAPITDAALVVPTIAQTLGIKEVSGQFTAREVGEQLAGKEMLLLLDNFEQVVGAAPIVAELLAVAPNLKVLATSREMLHLRGEQEYHVPTLSLPDPRRLPSIAAISQYDAVNLFIQRARLVRPDFEVNNQNAAAVAEICYRLDGLPLAIELAAARIRLLTPQALLERLASRLKLLTGGARDLPERHQTLRGTIQWSYDLLQPPEQRLFRRLSVFRGATLEAIEEVCNARGDLELDVLDGVTSLADKSLIRQETGADDEPYFLMLGTVREYALELLHQTDPAEAEEMHRQHAMYYLEVARKGDPALTGAEQALWFERTEAANDNMRAALEWAIDTEKTRLALLLAGTLWWFWQTRGYYSEGIKWQNAALALPGADQYPSERAYLVAGMSLILWRQNDYAGAREAAGEAIAFFREQQTLSVNDTRRLALALVSLGISEAFLDDYASGRPAIEEGVELFRQVREWWGLAIALFDLGLAAVRAGDSETARTALQESQALVRRLGDKWALSQVLNTQGDLARVEAEYARARDSYGESLALYREMDTRYDMAASLKNLGYALLGLGDVAQARAYFIEALQHQIDLKNQHGIAECLAGLAGVAGAMNQLERAARLFGAAEALRERLGASLWAADRADYERNLAAARSQLDAAEWEAAWAAGRAMSVEQAIQYALEEK